MTGDSCRTFSSSRSTAAAPSRSGACTPSPPGGELARRTGGELHVRPGGQDLAAVGEGLAGLGVPVHVLERRRLAQLRGRPHRRRRWRAWRRSCRPPTWAPRRPPGKDLLPRVAARLRAGMASEVLGFGGDGPAVTFRRPMWAGNVLAEVELASPVKVFTVRPTEFPAAAAEGGAGPGDSPTTEARSRRRAPATSASQAVKSARPELTEARVVVSGGRGTKGDFQRRRGAGRRAGRRGRAPAGPRSTPAGSPTTGRWGRPARWSRPSCTSRPASRGAIQHLAGHEGRQHHRGRSTRTPRRPSSRSPTTGWWPTCSRRSRRWRPR